MRKPRASTGQRWRRKDEPKSPPVVIEIDDYDEDASEHLVDVRCRCEVTGNRFSVSLAFLRRKFRLDNEKKERRRGR